jgi:hypothetical protein
MVGRPNYQPSFFRVIKWFLYLGDRFFNARCILYFFYFFLGFAFLNRIPSFRVKMSKKRGLSLEEKRTRMLEIFYEKKDFFLLKEMEKIAPREKGKADLGSTLVEDCIDNGCLLFR